MSIVKGMVSIINAEELSAIAFKEVTASDGGNYTCVAVNSFGTDSFTARLAVRCKSRPDFDLLY